MSTQLTFFFAFLVVLALIGAAAWLVRRFAGDRLKANSNRGRMPRLAVIDATAVDGRRRLVLVRRDNIEHLLMIGGPTDIVVESNIVRAMPARDQVAPRANVGGPKQRRGSRPSPNSGNWSDSDAPRDSDEVQMPEPPLRPARPSFADEVRRPAPPLPERRDPLAFTPEPAGRPEPMGRPEPRSEMRSEPMPPRAPPRSEPMMPRPPMRPSEPPPRAPPLRAPERAAPPPRSADGFGRPKSRRHGASPRSSVATARWPRPRRRSANHGSARRLWLRKRRPAAPHLASKRRTRRVLLRQQRPASRISKMRWRHCWVVQRIFREIDSRPA